MKMFMAVCAAIVLSIPATWAQTTTGTARPVTDTDIQLLRSDIQADGQKIIADTMQFSDAESTAFWPVYRDYARDQAKVGDQLVQLVKDYASNYASMTDDNASDMVQRLINVEDETNNLREDYWPRFKIAIGAKRAAKFYQVDHCLRLMVDVQLASGIPILP